VETPYTFFEVEIKLSNISGELLYRLKRRKTTWYSDEKWTVKLLSFACNVKRSTFNHSTLFISKRFTFFSFCLQQKESGHFLGTF
jgi:hypothetical protein